VQAAFVGVPPLGGSAFPAEAGTPTGCHSHLETEEPHLLTVLRYVERNPLRANMVDDADAWRWSSLWHRTHRNRAGLVDAGPVVLPRRWRQHVQARQTKAEVAALRLSLVRGSPFGDAEWQQRTAKQLGLESTLRPRGRPWPSPSEPA
jgi:putative transposase